MSVDLELARMQHELALVQARAEVAPERASLSVDPINKPRLPVYRDGEDITSFLVRFEHIAELLNLIRNTWAIHLGTLLSGRAVEIYASLPDSVTADYDDLKKALLSGFNKTPETYRQEFRNLRIRPDQTYEQFSTQLGRHLDLLLESRDTAKSYEGVRDFVILDQFLASVSSELRLYIKEHGVASLKDTVKLADNWSMARSVREKHVKSPLRSSSGGKANKIHIVKTDPSGLVRGSNPGGPRQSRGFDGKCFSCGSLGHRKSNCPKNPLATPKPFSGDSGRTQGSLNIKVSLSGSCPKELLSCGTVNGARVSSILRDTGCSAIIVSEEVLLDVNLGLCKRVEVLDYLGRRNVWPVVRCYISCKFFEGWVDAVRAPIKLCSVLIGNVPGVKGTSSEVSVPEVKESSKHLVQSVQTRAQRAREGLRSLHPLVVPNLDAMKLNRSEFEVLQQTCISLSDLRSKANSDEIDPGRGGMVSHFINKDGLLYRECTHSNYSPNIGKLTLVVPSECRKTVLSVAHESLLAGHFSHRKTEQRVRDHFFWPGMSSDMKRFCQPCDKCQRMCPKGGVKVFL